MRPWRSEIHRDRKQKGGCLGLGRRDGESVCNRSGVSGWDGDKVLQLDGGQFYVTYSLLR